MQIDKLDSPSPFQNGTNNAIGRTHEVKNRIEIGHKISPETLMRFSTETKSQTDGYKWGKKILPILSLSLFLYISYTSENVVV